MFWRFPGVWRCVRGGFRHAESESNVKNGGKRPPVVKTDKNINFTNSLFLCFLLITRTPYLGFGRDLVGMHPRSLPQLSKQLRDQNNSQKPHKSEIQNFKTTIKKTKRSTNRITNCLFLLFLVVILVPELFRKLRETPGKNSHQVWSKSERSCTSYDQKNITV